MNGRIKFHFTLANMMLMMIPLGAASACIAFAISVRTPVVGPVMASVAGLIGVSSAVGTLIDGWKGMVIGLVYGFQLLYMLATVIVFIAGFLLWWRH